MLTMGLSTREFRLYCEALCADHMVDFRVQILTLDHKVTASVTGSILSGQVDVDTSQECERSASLEVWDPDNRLGLDAGDPTSGGAYLDRMIQIHYGVRVDSLQAWVWAPVFTGPISSLKRADGVATMEAQGKESLLLAPTAMTITYDRGWAKSSILANALQRFGEKFRKITRWSAKTTGRIVLSGTEKPWPILKKIAGQLASSAAGTDPWFGYNGSGFAVLQSHSHATRWTFKPGDGGSILDKEPELSYDASVVRNYVRVTSGDSGNGKAAITATATAPKSSPFSPQNLGRGGVPRYIMEDVQGENITTKQQAQKLADQTLTNLLRSSVSVEFNSLVIPHLEPRDEVEVRTDKWRWRFQLTKFTIPLSADGQMSIGRNVLVRKANRR